MSNETTDELIKQKVDFYYKNSKAVHINLKKGSWKNGYIKEVSADFFMLDEFLEGLKPVFFLEIKDIDVYTIRQGKE